MRYTLNGALCQVGDDGSSRDVLKPSGNPKHQRSGSYGSNHDVADMLGWGMGKKSVPLEWDEDLNPALPGLPSSTDRRRRRCAVQSACIACATRDQPSTQVLWKYLANQPCC